MNNYLPFVQANQGRRSIVARPPANPEPPPGRLGRRSIYRQSAALTHHAEVVQEAIEILASQEERLARAIYTSTFKGPESLDSLEPDSDSRKQKPNRKPRGRPLTFTLRELLDALIEARNDHDINIRSASDPIAYAKYFPNPWIRMAAKTLHVKSQVIRTRLLKLNPGNNPALYRHILAIYFDTHRHPPIYLDPHDTDPIDIQVERYKRKVALFLIELRRPPGLEITQSERARKRKGSRAAALGLSSFEKIQPRKRFGLDIANPFDPPPTRLQPHNPPFEANLVEFRRQVFEDVAHGLSLNQIAQQSNHTILAVQRQLETYLLEMPLHPCIPTSTDPEDPARYICRPRPGTALLRRKRPPNPLKAESIFKTKKFEYPKTRNMCAEIRLFEYFRAHPNHYTELNDFLLAKAVGKISQKTVISYRAYCDENPPKLPQRP